LLNAIQRRLDFGIGCDCALHQRVEFRIMQRLPPTADTFRLASINARLAWMSRDEERERRRALSFRVRRSPDQRYTRRRRQRGSSLESLATPTSDDLLPPTRPCGRRDGRHHRDLFLPAVIRGLPRRYLVAFDNPVIDVQGYPVAFFQTRADLDKFSVVAGNAYVAEFHGLILGDQRNLRSATAKINAPAGTCIDGLLGKSKAT
jgi:hypothetical protein